MPDQRTENTPTDFDATEACLGYAFRDRDLLRCALTHSSSTTDKSRDNERLEFFGDAILAMVVCEHLYHTHPCEREGPLTEVKSSLVRGGTLARAARAMGLRPHLILGRGIAGRKRLPDSVYANIFEALVAAIHLDGGIAAARDFIRRKLLPVMDGGDRLAEDRNYKSEFQQRRQKDGGPVPEYRVLLASGPDHDKEFVVGVFVEDRECGRGRGGSKKEAEQSAARNALLGESDAPPGPSPAEG